MAPTADHRLEQDRYRSRSRDWEAQDGTGAPVPTIVQRIDALETSVNERFKTGSETISRKHDVLQSELRAFAMHLQQQPPKPPDVPPGMGADAQQPNSHFDVSTPARPAVAPTNDNPFQMPGVPIWANHGQPGEQHGAPQTPARHNNDVDFGVASVSLSSGGGANNQFDQLPSNVHFGRPNVGHNNGPNQAAHRQYRTPTYSQHVHAPLWNSVPNNDFGISKKQIGDLPIFDGEYDRYSHWKNKLTDHCADTNAYWRAILKHIQEANAPIDYHVLANTRYGHSTGWDLALDLWNFVSKRIGQTIYEKRTQLVHGIEGNGFELWRALFVQFEGGDEFVKLDGRTQLQNFPVISNTNGISDKLRDWQHQMNKFGGDIGPTTRKTMLLKILPEHLRQDVLKYGMHDCDRIIHWIAQTQTWSRSEEILKKRKGAVSAVLSDGYGNGPSPGGVDIPVPPTPAVSPELVAAIVAAVGAQPRGRERSRSPGNRTRTKSPMALARDSFPKGHCYHCDSPDHSRTANAKTGRAGCEKFAKILKDNGGKLPDGYKGAFEKHMDAARAKLNLKPKAKKTAAAITDRELLDWLQEDSDSSDSDFDRPCGAVWQSVGPRCCDPFALDQEFPPICTTATKNSFSALSDGHVDVDVDDPAPTISQATVDLENWAHRVTKKSDKKFKKKDFVVKTDADVAKLEKMFCGANRQKSAKAIQQIETNELDHLAALVERDASSLTSIAKASKRVWAMVDSGSFVTIANCAKAFPGHRIRPSAGSKSGVTYSNASGGDIPNRGEIVVTHQLADGSELDVPFQDGDVQVPIISVKDFVHKESVVKFKNDGGTIRLPSGSRMTFVEKFGVYFTCLNVVSGDPDGEHSSTEHLNSIGALERAIDVLDPRHLDVEDDVVPDPPEPEHERCRCCRRGRKTGFTRLA